MNLNSEVKLSRTVVRNILILIVVVILVIVSRLVYKELTENPTTIIVNVYNFTGKSEQESKAKYGHEYTMQLFQEKLQSKFGSEACDGIGYLLYPSGGIDNSIKLPRASCRVTVPGYLSARSLAKEIENDLELKQYADYDTQIPSLMDLIK
jgi:hypothetical protein